MENTSEYFISHYIEDEFHKDTVVDKWPLHITVAPPFEMPKRGNSSKEVIGAIGAIGRDLGPIDLRYGPIRSGAIPIEIGQEAFYGQDKEIQVVEVLDPSGKLKLLHKQLLTSLGNLGCTFLNLNPDWSGENYSPHATTKSGKRLDRPFFCTDVTLNQKTQNTKTILSTFDLCNDEEYLED